MNSNICFAFDIDNCLLVNHSGWDEFYRRVSKELVGETFIMTKNPDGSPDVTFSKKTPFGFFRDRIAQLNLPPGMVSEQQYLEAAEKIGPEIDYRGLANPFPGVIELLRELKSYTNRPPIVVTYGAMNMQLRVLEGAGLIDYFDISDSFFGAANKALPLTQVIEREHLSFLSFFGDAPSDMKAISSVRCLVERNLAVGVTAAGLSTREELYEAGAQLIMRDFLEVEREKLHFLLTMQLG